MRQARPARPLSRPLLLTTAAMGGVLAPLNSTMLAVALPELRGHFAADHRSLGWLVSSYLIAMAVAQPLGGRLGDQLGRARVISWGLVAFLGFSLAAALSPSLLVLVFLRTGQALVGAAIIPNGLAMLRESLPPDRLGRSVGLMGAAMSLAAAAGPLIGTALLATGSWRLLFLMNVPLVLIAVTCVRRLSYQEHGERRRATLDVPGALALAAILVAATLVLGSAGSEGDSPPLLAGTLSLLLLVPVFIGSQRASPVPVIEWGLFRRRSFAGAAGYVLLSNLVMYTTLVSIPFFVQEVQGRGSGTSGTLVGAMSLGVAVMSPVGGKLSDRLGRRGPALAGGLIVVVASGTLLAGFAREASPAFLVGALALLGLGLGMGSGPATAAAAEAVPCKKAGAAAGVNSMMRYVGGIAGVGILSVILEGAGGTPDAAPFRAVFAVLCVVSALAAGSTLFIRGRLPSAAAAEHSAESGLQVSPPPSIGGPPMTSTLVWLHELGKDDVALAGGKGANLGELIRIGIPVPAGFVVTSHAYRHYLQRTGLGHQIAATLKNLDPADHATVGRASRRIERLFEATPMPVETARGIRRAYDELGTPPVPVAVRSSATAEDLPEASFAGQQLTLLNVSGADRVVEAVRRCWASLYGPQAISYRAERGYGNDDLAIAVPVQKMVHPESAGIMFTVNPVSRSAEQIVIEAVWGLGEAAVSGVVTPDTYLVDKRTWEEVERSVVPQDREMVCDPETRGLDTTGWTGVPPRRRHAAKLSRQHSVSLARLGARIEDNFGRAQDVEWAVEGDALFVLQARPVTTLS